MPISLFQIFLVIIFIEIPLSALYLLSKINKKRETKEYEKLKEKWQAYPWKRIYTIMIFIAATYFISISLSYNENFLQAGRAMLGSIFPSFGCNPVTKYSQPINGLISHSFTLKIDKGVYAKGETAVMSIELNPGVTSLEKNQLSNQIDGNIYYYDGKFDGNDCTGALVKTQPESIKTDDLTGSGTKKVERRKIIDLSAGCYCIKFEATNFPGGSKFVYLQTKVTEQTESSTNGETTTTIEQTSSPDTKTLVAGIFTVVIPILTTIVSRLV